MRWYDTRPAAPKVVVTAPATKPAEPVAPARVANVNFDKEPLWAYGFIEPAKPGDRAQPQASPTSKPRPGQDLNEQMMPRKVDGSSASYSLVQIRDLHNVIDWFPTDHPKMTY